MVMIDTTTNAIVAWCTKCGIFQPDEAQVFLDIDRQDSAL